MRQKICGVCKEKKDVAEFHRNSGMKDRLQNKCKACQKIMNSEYYRRVRVHIMNVN